MEDCIFCKIIKGEIPSRKIYEGDDLIAFLDIAPVSKGHTLVVPKKHYQHIKDTPDELLAKLMSAVKKIGEVVLKTVDSKAFNVGINDGKPAGQLVPHIHVHIMPRFDNDGKHLWKPTEEKIDLDELADKIKENL